MLPNKVEYTVPYTLQITMGWETPPPNKHRSPSIPIPMSVHTWHFDYFSLLVLELVVVPTDTQTTIHL